MLRTRIASAAVLIPLVLGGVYAGGAWLAALAAVAGVLAGLEFMRLVRADETSPQGPATPAPGLGIAIIVAFLVDGWRPDLGLLPWVLGLVALGPLLVQVFRHNAPGALNGWALTAAGAVYIGFSLSLALRLRGAPAGREWLFVALGGTWLCDTGAYLVGRLWGRRPFFPAISPRKTAEGAVGGLVVGTLSVVGLVALFGAPASWWQAAIVGALLSLGAIGGDLAESVIKRQLGAKDSSRLIPGHGGALDRIDSLLYTIPIVYYMSAALVTLTV